jgi:hypothetical protein
MNVELPSSRRVKQWNVAEKIYTEMSLGAEGLTSDGGDQSESSRPKNTVDGIPRRAIFNYDTV